jgi:hypothetical protein
MTYTYPSGEEIKRGDRITYHDVPGGVEFVVDPVNNPDDWYVKEHGGGIMIIDSRATSFSFHDPSDQEDLLFISRGS